MTYPLLAVPIFLCFLWQLNYFKWLYKIPFSNSLSSTLSSIRLLTNHFTKTPISSVFNNCNKLLNPWLCWPLCKLATIDHAVLPENSLALVSCFSDSDHYFPNKCITFSSFCFPNAGHSQDSITGPFLAIFIFSMWVTPLPWFWLPSTHVVVIFISVAVACLYVKRMGMQRTNINNFGTEYLN